MAVENKITVSLVSKDTAKISLSLSDDSGSVVASATDISPVIKFITTGPAGPPGDNAIINDNAITSAKIANGAVTGAKLSSSAVTVTKINNSAVSTAKIQNSAVTTDKIANQSVTINKLANNSVGPEQIIDGTVTTELLNDGAITADKYGDLSIATAKLKDLSVTSAKLASNLSLEGTTTVKHLIGLGTSPFTITGPTTDNFELISKQDLVFQVDADQSLADGNHSFIWKNGSGTQIAALDESGNLTISGTVDGIDISTLQNLYPTADATKVGFLTVTQAVDLDTLESNVTTNNAKNTYPSADATKVGYLQVTQSVNLDLIETNLSGVIDKTQYISVSQAVDLDTLESNVATNNAKVGITAQQASDITANNSKVGITTSQADAIVANTAKVGITTQQASDITANNAKVGITTQQASDITSNNAKTSFPGFGTTSGTALEGDTALLQLGTTSTTALAGDTTTISSSQASAITANTAKVGITTSQADAITANTAKPDLTVDGAGTIHANNVPTLNQDTTGNAATATALAAGNQTIDGDVNIGASQAGHDFTLHGATTQYSNIVWDASMNFLKVADASKIVFGNGFSATDFDSSIQANGSNLVIYNDTGNVQIGDTVEITGDLTVTGTVDGIDIATDVAANTAKTSFPGFGTTAGTALEGNTTIPTQYTDSDALNAVTTADNFLKNDTADTIEGDLTVDSDFLYIKDQSGSAAASRFTTTTLTANRTLTMPDATGTLALTSNITPTIIGQFSTRVSAYWSGRYYFGQASYGWNYFAWNYATTSKTTMNDQYVHMGMVSPISTNNVKLRATVRNDSNTENVELCLLKGSRPNGSSSNISLTELGSVTVTITTQDLHYNGDIDVTDANLSAGDLVFLAVRRVSSAANATKYINVTATIYGE